MSSLKKVLAIFEVEGKRGAYLESCYGNLNSIPQRVFSRCGGTVTKIR
jgi:hypothetical protein